MVRRIDCARNCVGDVCEGCKRFIAKKEIEIAQNTLLEAGYKIILPAHNTNADQRPITEITLYTYQTS